MTIAKTKIQKTTGHGLDFYYDATRVVRGAEMKAKSVKRLGKTLTYWFSEDGNFLFNRTAANALATHMRKKLQDLDQFGLPGLSTYWKEEKHRRGLDERLGIATGSMLNAIDFYSAGYSEYKVGISKNARANLGAGGTGKIIDYATWFEEGRPPAGKEGRNAQPPRPWFGMVFREWMKYVFPGFFWTVAGNEFKKRLQELGEKSMQISIDDAYYVEETIKERPKTWLKGGAFKQEGPSDFSQEVSSKPTADVKTQIREKGELKQVGQATWGKKVVSIWKKVGAYGAGEGIKVLVDSQRKVYKEYMEIMEDLSDVDMWY